MERRDKKAFLTRHLAFASLRADDIERLAEKARVRPCAAGETIFCKGDATTGLMAVVSGRIHIVTHSEDGKELVLNTMHAGEMLGEIGVIDGGERTADAVAAEKSALLTIDRRSFLDVVGGNPAFALALMTLLCQRIRATSEQAEDLALLDLNARLAKKLVQLAGEHGESQGPVTLTMSQKDLGAMMGTTREAVNKHLGVWAREGLISLARGAIVVRDADGLRRVFEG